MSSRILWTTKSVVETIEKLRQGADVDLGCFHNQNPELKAANVLFQLTPQEEQEFIKCSSNIEYFVETYCRFLTDAGRVNVPLRDYQVDILSTLGEEEWIEELEDWGPKARNFILMSARQSGKCFFVDTKLTIKNSLTKEISTIKISDLYDIINKTHKKNLKNYIIYKIKKFLYSIYNKLS